MGMFYGEKSRRWSPGTIDEWFRFGEELWVTPFRLWARDANASCASLHRRVEGLSFRQILKTPGSFRQISKTTRDFTFPLWVPLLALSCASPEKEIQANFSQNLSGRASSPGWSRSVNTPDILWPVNNRFQGSITRFDYGHLQMNTCSYESWAFSCMINDFNVPCICGNTLTCSISLKFSSPPCSWQPKFWNSNGGQKLSCNPPFILGSKRCALMRGLQIWS